MKPVAADDLDLWERKLERQLANDSTVPETERLAIIRARNGQGLFKERVAKIETRCRITGVENPVHLIASHCKPWRDATNEERLNGENGLLLTPSIDHLFDRGFIGFEDNGKLIISPVAHRPSLQRMGIDTTKVCQCGRIHQRAKAVSGFPSERCPASVCPSLIRPHGCGLGLVKRARLPAYFASAGTAFPGIWRFRACPRYCASVQISQHYILSMGIRMRTFTSADAKNNFGELIDLARAAPVAITKYDRRVVVVMAVEEYENLTRPNDRSRKSDKRSDLKRSRR